MEKILLAILLFILVGVIFYFVSQKYSIYGNKIKAVSINGQKFKVEVVNNRRKILKGLGGRKSLCYNRGMLFEFNCSLKMYRMLKSKIIYGDGQQEEMDNPNVEWIHIPTESFFEPFYKEVCQYINMK
jgi:hypothetical protein